MILKNIKKGNIQDLNLDHLHFKVVTDSLSVNLINLHAIQGIVIKANDIKIVRQILSQIRSKSDPKVYLMPVYLESRVLFKQIGSEVDGYLMEGINPLNSSSGEEIRSRIEHIQNDLSKVGDYNQRMILKALQFAYTRNSELKPYRDRISPIGYHLPFISTVVAEKEIVHVFSKLDKLVDKGQASSKLLDKVNLCNGCQSSYLNFHETCSKCSSIDLEYENLVHHFRCAYIGPESDFMKDDAMICPKCDKQLKHIGIDYDKPAEVASCNQCTHTSQETKMKASCIDCGEHNSLSQLNTLTIKQFASTMEGIDHLLNEQPNSTESAAELSDLNIVPTPIFNLLIEQEKARVANRTEGSSYACDIMIDDSIFNELAEDFRNQLKVEVLKIMKTYLRKIDVLCARHAGHYSFMLPDCKQSKAYDLYLLVLDNLNKLLTDNLKSSVPLVTGDLKKL